MLVTTLVINVSFIGENMQCDGVYNQGNESPQCGNLFFYSIQHIGTKLTDHIVCKIISYFIIKSVRLVPRRISREGGKSAEINNDGWQPSDL